MKHLEQVLEIPGGRMICPHSPVKFIPCMFDWVEVWATGRPLKSDDTSLLEVVIYHPSPVWGGIIILKDGLRSQLLESRQD